MKIILFLVTIVILGVGNALGSKLYCSKKKTKCIENQGMPKDNCISGRNILASKIKLYVNGWIRLNLIWLGKVPCHHLRKFILTHIYQMEVKKNVVIYGGFEIRAPWNIKIGEGSIIGDDSKLDGRNGIIIGNNVNLSTGVWIWTEQHDVNDPFFSSKGSGGQVIIEDRAWLSSRTTILPNIHIGEGAVLAANALATKNLEDYGIYGGVPAKKIGKRNKKLEYCFSGEYIPFY